MEAVGEQGLMRGRFTLVGAGALGAGVVAAGVWLIRLRPPSSLAGSPSVDVTVRAQKSKYPDVAETAGGCPPARTGVRAAAQGQGRRRAGTARGPGLRPA
ncbi:hypothetical protein GCM10010446_09240 [Streptomyces enissocaesilis]|uniref:Uncharacterized protein n=1 Tax=Streptomyces enissocaesilis TaxID=332589 RepID=A0ABP6JCX1_9ACTN